MLEAYGYRWYRVGGLDYLLEAQRHRHRRDRQDQSSGVMLTRLVVAAKEGTTATTIERSPNNDALIAPQIQLAPQPLALPIQQR